MTPVMLQQKMARAHGIRFHISYVRKIMRRYGMTPKTAVRIHVNCATKGAVYGWQSRLDDRISRLKEQGFTIITADEAFFTYDTKSGRKYWPSAGTRIMRPYNGNHKKIAAYGAVADDRRQLFRLYESAEDMKKSIRTMMRTG